MSGVSKISIVESVETLKTLLKQQKTGLGFTLVQGLYLLNIAVENINHLAVIIGTRRVNNSSLVAVLSTRSLRKIT